MLQSISVRRANRNIFKLIGFQKKNTEDKYTNVLGKKILHLIRAFEKTLALLTKKTPCE